MNFRIGLGYDVHRLVDGRKLIIGGENVPFEKGLLGHSDADVLSHAIADALLGAACLGDIGKLFPDTDQKYKNYSSLKLLAEVAELLKGENYNICNIDCSLVLEQPKIASFSDKMRKNISESLGIAIDQVSIKATTSEKLGFVGNGEGAQAFAIAMLVR